MKCFFLVVHKKALFCKQQLTIFQYPGHVSHRDPGGGAAHVVPGSAGAGVPAGPRV